MADIRRGDSLYILMDEYTITTTRLWVARAVMTLLLVLSLVGGGAELVWSLTLLEVGGALFGLFVMYATLVRFLASKPEDDGD